MKHIIKNRNLFFVLLLSAASFVFAAECAASPQVLQVTKQRVDEHEQAISKLVYNRQLKRYALYAALSSGAAYTLYWFFSDHDVSFLPDFEKKTYVTKEGLQESQKQLCEALVKEYGLSKKDVGATPAVDAKKSAALYDLFWSFAGKLKSSSLSIAQFGLASILLTKTEGIFFSHESIGWFYTTEQSIFEKAQNCINWAGVCDADLRPDATSTRSTQQLNKQFFLESAHEYIDSLMALIGFMNYKVKSLEAQSQVSCAPSFTSILEAVTLYATELALKLESRIAGNVTYSLQDEVRKTDRLIESLYKKFLILEKKYS